MKKLICVATIAAALVLGGVPTATADDLPPAPPLPAPSPLLVADARVDGLQLDQPVCVWGDQHEPLRMDGAELPAGRGRMNPAEFLAAAQAEVAKHDARVPEQRAGIASMVGVFTGMPMRDDLDAQEMFEAGWRAGLLAAVEDIFQVGDRSAGVPVWRAEVQDWLRDRAYLADHRGREAG